LLLPSAGEEHWLCICFVIHVSPGFLGTGYPERDIFLIFNKIGKKEGTKRYYFFFPSAFPVVFTVYLLVLCSSPHY